MKQILQNLHTAETKLVEVPCPQERLEKMGEFVVHVTKPTGRVHQIGDNDSGRFLKLQPRLHKITVREAKASLANLAGYDELNDTHSYWLENHLDYRHLVAAINGFFARPDFAKFANGCLDTDIVLGLCGDWPLPSIFSVGRLPMTKGRGVGSESTWEEVLSQWAITPFERRQEIFLPIAQEMGKDLCRLAYPDFGFYIFRSARFYLAVRCGSIGHSGQGSHAHNDQLAVELTVENDDRIADPGTYLYTPLAHRRNEYRSVNAHFAPRVEGKEPDRIDLGLFRLGDETQAECLYFGSRGFIGRHFGYGVPVWRVLEMAPDAIIIRDFLSSAGQIRNSLKLVPLQIPEPSLPPFSPGYGIIHKSSMKSSPNKSL